MPWKNYGKAMDFFFMGICTNSDLWDIDRYNVALKQQKITFLCFESLQARQKGLILQAKWS